MASRRPVTTEGKRPSVSRHSSYCLPILSSNSTAPAATDKAWAVAFKIDVAVILMSALYFGSAGIEALDGVQLFVEDKNIFSGDVSGGNMLVPALYMVGVVVVGWMFLWGLLSMISAYSKKVLQVPLCTGATIAGLAIVRALATKHWFRWLVPAALYVWSVFSFLKRHKSRLIFSSANLKVAALAIKAMPWTICAVLLLVSVQVVWIMLWVVIVAGSRVSLRVVTGPDGTVYSASTCSEVSGGDGSGGHAVSCAFEAWSGSFWLEWFWLVSVVWGIAVLRTLVTATVTGSVASWWFSPKDKSSVRGALYRATHGSFGSLCKAAAMCGVVRVAIATFRRIVRVGWCANFLLRWLRDAVNYAQTYTICFISAYGLSCSEGVQRVSELFRRRGVTAIANDLMVDIGLASFIVGASVLFFVAAFSALVVAMVRNPGSMNSLADGELAVRALCCSYFLVAIFAATMVDVLRSGLKAVFVCFAQDPEALEANHAREMYEDLSKAWRGMQADRPSTTSEPEHSSMHYA